MIYFNNFLCPLKCVIYLLEVMFYVFQLDQVVSDNNNPYLFDLLILPDTEVIVLKYQIQLWICLYLPLLFHILFFCFSGASKFSIVMSSF